MSFHPDTPRSTVKVEHLEDTAEAVDYLLSLLVSPEFVQGVIEVETKHERKAQQQLLARMREEFARRFKNPLKEAEHQKAIEFARLDHPGLGDIRQAIRTLKEQWL